MSTDELKPDMRTAGTTDDRIVAKNTGKQNNTWSIDDEHIRRMSNFIRYSLKGRWLYRKMMTLMFFESVAWTVLDLIRAARMKAAEEITKNKHIDRVTKK